MKDVKEVTNKQIEYYKKTNGAEQLVDQSLGDLVFYFVGQNNEKTDLESRNLNRSLGLNEQLYFSHVIRGYADKLLWPEVNKIIKMKSPPVPFSNIAEILYAANNRELAADTFCKVPDKEQRIELLMDHQFWIPAMEEMCKNKLHEEYEDMLIGAAQ